MSSGGAGCNGRSAGCVATSWCAAGAGWPGHHPLPAHQPRRGCGHRRLGGTGRHRHGPAVCGDATDEAVLQAAGIDRAGVLITALNSDADNLYVTLTGRSMCPDLFIVSRTASDAAVPKLIHPGADRVVNPQDLGGARMAALAVQPHVAEFLNVVMHDGSLEFRLQEIDVPSGSPLVGQTLRSARVPPAPVCWSSPSATRARIFAPTRRQRSRSRTGTCWWSSATPSRSPP